LIKAFCLDDIETLTDLAEKIDKESLNEMKEKIKRILDYPLPICIMETFNEDEETFKSMAEAFIRVNKFGVRIGNLELMLSFLAGAISGELKKRIRDVYESLYTSFEIDLQPIIRFVFSNFGLKQTQISKVEQFKSNITKISGYSKNDVEDIFNKCHKALKLVLNLLQQELGINNSQLLPSHTPLIPLAAYFYTRNINTLEELDNQDIQHMVNWFVLASFTGYYSSQTDTKLDRDLEIIKNSKIFPYQQLLENMRNAKSKIKITFDDVKRGLYFNVLRLQGRSYLFLLYILLVKKGADDWTGVLLHRKSIKELAKHHIFPQEFLNKNLNPDDPDAKEILINNLANITFINKNINSEIEDSPEEYLPNYINCLLKHFIPSDKNLWKLEQYSTFLEYRIRQIYLVAKETFPLIFD
jgi:hypothetical protein